MSFVPNSINNEQLSLFDSFQRLTEREQRVLPKSWAKPFAEIIIPAIDEMPFSVYTVLKIPDLHSSKCNGWRLSPSTADRLVG